jgi:hypothetical protein
MKKLLFISFALVVVASTGCLKDTPATDLSNVSTIIEMIYPNGAQDNGVGTGLEFFTGEQLPFYPTDVSDTITYYVNIAGTNTLSKPLTVDVAFNSGALADNIANDGITYLPLPDSCYTLLPATGTIPAGKRLDTFQVVYYPSKIDLTQNYGAPIALAVSGYTVSGNFGTLYLHTIGNPIGGTYNQSFVKYYDSAGTGTPYTIPASPVGIFNPLDNSDIEVPSLDSSGIQYVISFTNTNGVASGFSVSLDPNYIPKGTIITSGPNITADPVNKIYTVNFTDSTTGTGGFSSNITDKFTWVSNY